MELQNAWISDRSICYLASGRPAVVQHTGPSRFLPDQSGLLRFHTLDEAVELLALVEENYEAQSAAALKLAQDHFDGCKTLARLLDQALQRAPRGRSAHA